MKRLLAALLAVLMVAGAVPAAATLGTTATTAESGNETKPGATFAGVVGVQQAEVGNEVAQRALDQRLEAADSNASKAAVVANETEGIERRLAELADRREAIEAAYENGSITKAQRDARLAALAAQVRALERRANQTADVAADLPAEALQNHGVNVTEIRSLAHRANELGGGAVAEAARSIAGEHVGNGLGKAPEHARNRGNGTERGGDRGASDRGANASERNGGKNASERGGDGRSGQAGNRTAGGSNTSDSAAGDGGTAAGNDSTTAGNDTDTDGTPSGTDGSESGAEETDAGTTDSSSGAEASGNETRTETRG